MRMFIGRSFVVFDDVLLCTYLLVYMVRLNTVYGGVWRTVYTVRTFGEHDDKGLTVSCGANSGDYFVPVRFLSVHLTSHQSQTSDFRLQSGWPTRVITYSIYESTAVQL